MNKLPASFKQYFWDVDFESLDPERDAYLIIETLIEFGDTLCVRWISSNYGLERVREITMKSEKISRKTANFWADMFEIDHRLVPALCKPYVPKPKKQVTTLDLVVQ